MKKLEGKIALITGSDSGIGKAIAVEFATEGANVVICYHSDEEGAKKAATEIEGLGVKTLIQQVDVGDEQNIKQLYKNVFDKFGELDIVVNNAAVNTSHIMIEDMTTELFDKTLKTNLYSVFFSCREFVGYLKKNSKKGKIVNISSVHEDIVAPGGSDYNASKGAVKNLTRTIALEVASFGINVNNIAPGMILTPMNKEAMENKEVRDEASSHIPAKRPGQPEEVAKVALFLASGDSDYVNGSTYFIDGGLSLNVGQGA
ncbi:SDR family oxidoreductase [Pedobacter sp. HMF7647]|uniref:SDR family oxidoreductase n=1 Tax=Hufsiella arboris TaxID=2695275 RepID=A0A7K1YA16_9SPHI|nr:SDR family oxidoreductase [Hufsiella arboris]MXV51436.1 SDR family oxidoreductase [Hufsiella arboris]